MKAEFEYSESEVWEIVLQHHHNLWGERYGEKIWVARTGYPGIIVRLEEPKEEATDES